MINRQTLVRIAGVRRRAMLAVRAVSLRVVVGFTILAMACLLYLGPYFADTAACLDDMARGMFSADPVEWHCLKNVLADLRKDNTAATVILAIAAAILASAWSSGSDVDSDADTDADAVA